MSELVQMKLVANRERERVHLRDLIDVDLVTHDLLPKLPLESASTLDLLLTEEGR
jgi:hypothetical protein